MKPEKLKKSESDSDDSDYRSLRIAAMDYLSRREHSKLELRRKLERRFATSESLLKRVLRELVAQQLLSDERFTEAFVRSRRLRGQGPVRIAAELRQRGVDDSLASSYLETTGCDWREAALAVYRKRYGEGYSDDARERARRQRFLQQRGFTAEQVRYAISASNSRH